MISLLRLMVGECNKNFREIFIVFCFTFQTKTEALCSPIFLDMRCVFGYFKPNTRYYGSSDYLCVIFLDLPFRCGQSPITTIY